MEANNAVFNESDYIIVQGHRIFIDINVRGCGSGCLYCYAPFHDENQQLLSEQQIVSICRYISSKYSCNNTIVSLCPNTEPLKSARSMQLVLLIIKWFADKNCFLQISTKESIPESFLEAINKLSKNNVFINISIPILHNANNIEPHAASVEQRLANFASKDLYRAVHFCLYIKPFMLSVAEQKQFIELINQYQIETVCVGVKFTSKSEIPCLSLYSKSNANAMFKKQGADICDFIEMIHKETDAHVFGSSVCCIYSSYFAKCDLELYNFERRLCNSCTLRRN